MIDFIPDWLEIILAVLLMVVPVQTYRTYRRKPLEGRSPFLGSTIDYWAERSRLYGRRAVLNLQYGENDVERVTERQVREIFPFVKKSLQGWEKIVLDFGCGTGRFSKALAELVDGRTIATDPIGQLLSLAPQAKNVDYRLMQAGRIPLANGSVDFLWICLVLGGIPNVALKETLRELDRVLKPGALVCLVENTSSRKNSNYWTYRGVDHYRNIFDFASLARVHQYDELGEEISIFVGRKKLFTPT